MDSLTHLAIGATVFEAVLGKKIGNRAALWGAITVTLPDLDVFLPMGGPVEAFTYHRGFSHSLIVLAAASPVVAWAITRVQPATAHHWRGWLLAVFLTLITHPLFDGFTVYGTQLLWPLSTPPVSWSTIFIIDPLFTLPLVVGIFGALLLTRQTLTGHRMALTGLALTIAYLAWTVVAKTMIDRRLEAALVTQGLAGKPVMTTPTPFNTVLWRVVVMDQDRYYEGYISLFDDPANGVALTSYPTNPALLAGLGDHWPVQRLKWFTDGFYSVRASGPDIVMTDLRMGVEGSYIFAFIVGRLENGISVPVANARASQAVDFSRLGNVWRRIWDAEVIMAPKGEQK